MNCIHNPAGLCPECQADYGLDPAAWEEFGNHEAGLARWKAAQEQIAADQQDAVSAAEPDPEMPY